MFRGTTAGGRSPSEEQSTAPSDDILLVELLLTLVGRTMTYSTGECKDTAQAAAGHTGQSV